MDKETNKKRIFTYLKAFLIGIAATTILICIFALVMYFLPEGYKFSPIFATLSLAVGVFFAAFYIAVSTGEKGWLIGLIVGGVVFILLTLISLIVSKGGLTVNTLFRFIIIMLSALMGGILGVNRQAGRKYI